MLSYVATDSLLSCFSMFVYGKTKTEVILNWAALVEMDGLDLAKYSSYKTRSESPEQNLALLVCANSFIPAIWEKKDFIF